MASFFISSIKKNSILFTKKIPTILAGIMDKNFARFKISTPVVPAGPHTVIFQNKEESSCPHSYYARLQKKRIFVRKKTTIRQPFSMQLF